MLMSRPSFRAFMHSLLLLAPLATAADPVAPDVLGHWHVEHRRPGISRHALEVEATILPQVGELTFQTRGWEELPDMRCRYHLNTSVDPVVAREDGTGQGNCPATMSFSLSAQGRERIVIDVLDGSLAGEIGLGELALSAILRPLSPEERPMLDVSLDVVGVSSGMTRDEVASVLLDKGYELSQPAGWTENGIEVALDRWVQPGARDDGDTIAVQYSSKVEGSTAEVLVQSIERRWQIPASENMTVASLRRALEAKYGQVNGQDGRATTVWAFGRDGRPATFDGDAACGAGPSFLLPTTFSLGGYRYFEVSTNCVAIIAATIGTAKGDELEASGLLINVVDVDLAARASWRAWATQSEARIRSEIERLDGAAMPDL